MSEARYLIGDVFDRMAELEDGSIDLVLTSPPFLALRSYLPADHPDKAKEIGSEPTPAAFLDTLLALTAEWRRLLAPHGSIAVELGDTYAGGGQGPDANHKGSLRPVAASHGPGWPLAKSLCGIPHLYHLSLAYGRNLLTGEPSPAGQWRVRNVVAWCRPNPPVGALGDKFRPGTSYMTIACVSGSRYFDLDAVRTEHKGDPTKPGGVYKGSLNGTDYARWQAGEKSNQSPMNPAGAPPLDWWEIPTQPYAGSHYATWPSALCEKPIKSMVPQRVCLTCGEPSRRIVENHTERYDLIVPKVAPEINGMPATGRGHGSGRAVTTLGWTDCGHDARRNGMVLDPFAGSGTTLAVATGHGRNAIGIDLDARNADLARERVGGLFLTVETPVIEEAS